MVLHWSPLERERLAMRSKVLPAQQRRGPVIVARSRSIRRALVLCGLLSLAADPAGSQTRDQDVRVTLSKLPPHTSAAYRTLRTRAGNAPIQMLPLTKAHGALSDVSAMNLGCTMTGRLTDC